MRARSLKPGFFSNEELLDLPFDHRLLFAGLWCIADREGRLEDRPKRIKLHVFPGDDVNVEAALTALCTKHFIQRYKAGNTGYIQILSWKKNQHPHANESPSSIPAPPKDEAGTTTAVQETPLTLTLGLSNRVSDTHNARATTSTNGRSFEDAPAVREPDGPTPEEILADYPPTPNGSPAVALHQIAALICSGEVSAGELLEATRRFRRYVEAGGRSSPSTVQGPEKFYVRTEPDKPAPWSKPWDPPRSKAEQQQDANVSAAREWLQGSTA